MRRRRAIRVGFVVLALAGILVLIPGTPIYLPNLVPSSGRYDGRSMHHWIKSLASGDAKVRQQAAHALGMIGPQLGEAVPELARVLRHDPQAAVRCEAALALSKMNPASGQAVPELAQALGDEELSVRMHAAMALFRLRGEARPAVPALLEALKDTRNRSNLGTFTLTIQEMVALALGRASAGSGDAVVALSAALDGADTEAEMVSFARALGEVGAEARPATDKLRHLLGDNSSDVREAAEEALALIEGRAAAKQAARGNHFELPEAERGYIWEIEHRGNILTKHGFGPLASALKAGDAAALSRLMADDFTGADLNDPRRIQVSGYAQVERLEDAGHPPLPLSRDSLVARLLEFRALFRETAPQVRFSLITLSPKRRGDLDGAWEGTALLRLHGEHNKGAPAEIVVQMRFELAALSEPALARPGWLCGVAIVQVLQATAPRYLFAEVARERGLDTTKVHDNWNSKAFHASPGGAYVCDVDRDGTLDLLITDVNGCTLYQGRPGGRFVDVTARFGLLQKPVERSLAAWVDVDGDGWEDLILADRVYRNEEGKRFVDVTARCNLRLPADAVSIVVADYDRDAKLDLYVTRITRPGGNSWLESKSGDSKGNHLFRNKGNWQFEDVTRASGTLGGHRSTFTAAWLDANNDGWPDLHVPNEFGDGVLLVNNRDGTFSEQPLAGGPADFGTMGLAAGDLNNDGHIDLYCANMFSKAGTRVIGNMPPEAYPPEVMAKIRRFVAGSQVHLNKGGLKFEQVGPEKQVAAVGWAYGTCLADLDNDGWLDIYATAGFVSKSRDEPDG